MEMGDAIVVRLRINEDMRDGVGESEDTGAKNARIRL